MVFQDGARINFHAAVEKMCPKKIKNGESSLKVPHMKSLEHVHRTPSISSGTPTSCGSPSVYSGDGSLNVPQMKTPEVKQHCQPATMYNASPYANFRPPPGLSLDDFDRDPLAILHQNCLKFGEPLPLREPSRGIDGLVKPCHTEQMFERISRQEDEQVPMKVIPQFCRSHQEQLVTSSWIIEDAVDDVSSTTASEDEPPTMDDNAMWLALNGLSYGFQAKTRKCF
jgi:hypothetical protein